jgi:Ca2+/Na+ antiporter
VGSSGRELGLVILFFLFVFVFFVSLFFVFWILMLFSHCRKINNEPETKNLKNQKNKKKQDCIPQGGSSGRELDLVILFFYGCLVFCFFVSYFLCFFSLVLFDHCIKIKKKLSMITKQWENHRRCSGYKDVQIQ